MAYVASQRRDPTSPRLRRTRQRSRPQASIERGRFTRIALAELKRAEPAVETLGLGGQFVVRPELDDPAAINDGNLVGVAHGGEPVGDDKGGAALHQPVEGKLHQPLALAVQRTGGFI